MNQFVNKIRLFLGLIIGSFLITACGGGGSGGPGAPTVENISFEDRTTAIEKIDVDEIYTNGSSAVDPYRVIARMSDGTLKDISRSVEFDVSVAGSTNAISNAVFITIDSQNRLVLTGLLDQINTVNKGNALPSDVFTVSASYTDPETDVTFSASTRFSLESSITAIDIVAEDQAQAREFDEQNSVVFNVSAGDTLKLNVLVVDAGVSSRRLSDSSVSEQVEFVSLDTSLVQVEQDSGLLEIINKTVNATTVVPMMANFRGITFPFNVEVHPKGWVRNLSGLKIVEDGAPEQPIQVIENTQIQLTTKGIISNAGLLSEVNLTDVTWVSSNPNVATVSSTGVLTAISAQNNSGIVSIEVTAGGFATTVPVRVRPEGWIENLTAITVLNSAEPNLSIELPVGNDIQLSARGTITDGVFVSETTLANVEWRSLTPNVAVISDEGVLTALSEINNNGIARIEVTAGDVTAVVEVVVHPTGWVRNLTSISIVNTANPSQPIQVAENGVLQLTARGIINNGGLLSEVVLSDVEWESLNPIVATVSETGVLRGVSSVNNDGIATIQVTAGEITTSAQVLVRREVLPQELVEIRLMPADEELEQALVSVGGSLQLRAIGVFAGGLEGPINPEWSSSNVSRAQVGQFTGVVTGLTPGTVTITAEANDVTATISVLVTETECDQDIVVDGIFPANAVLEPNNRLQYTLKGTKNGQPINISDVIWRVDSEPTVASISPFGELFASNEGSLNVGARYCNLDYSTPVSIEQSEPIDELVGIVISPTSRELVVGGEFDFEIFGRYSNQTGLVPLTVENERRVLWSSSNIAVAEVDNSIDRKGRVTAVSESAEVVVITARLGDFTANAQVRVSAREFSSISLTVNRTTLAIGQTTQLQLFAVFNNGDRVDVTQNPSTNWSIESDNNIDVDNAFDKGLVTALEEGTGRVIATYLSETATVEFNVIDRDFVTVHYHRDDNDYNLRGLHIWRNAAEGVEAVDPSEVTVWNSTYKELNDIDEFGAVYDVQLVDETSTFCFIVLQANPGAWNKSDDMLNAQDHCFVPQEDGLEVWVNRRDNTLVFEDPNTQTNVSGVVYWLDEDTLAAQMSANFNGSVTLHYVNSNLDGNFVLSLDENGIVGGESVTLDQGGSVNGNNYPSYMHVNGMTTLSLPGNFLGNIDQMLKGPLFVSFTDNLGQLIDQRPVLTAPVIDDLYATDVNLHVEYGLATDEPSAIKLWAPTAIGVTLKVYEKSGATYTEINSIDGTDPISGVWNFSRDLTQQWAGQFYRFEVTTYQPSLEAVQTYAVTNPYSTALSANGAYSQFINPAVHQSGAWGSLTLPHADLDPVDYVLYELHIRDFSIYDETVSINNRGKFAGFSDPLTDGMQHLADLANDDDLPADGGITHVQLLPIYDFDGVDESVTHAPFTTTVPSVSDGASTLPRSLINADDDGYDFGYNGLHFMVPEGSYSSDPDSGDVRIMEARDMIESLNALDLRIAMDVAFNAMPLDGDIAPLDKIVPGYYYRLDGSGAYEQDSCAVEENCADTATENQMMAKLMVDSVVYWAEQFKVSAFRFNQMSFLDVRALQDIRSALNVEFGGDYYLYGEAWDNGGLVARNADIAATAENVTTLGIASFNGVFRDAARGGSPVLDIDDQDQGFMTGLWTVPQNGTATTAERDALFGVMNQIRLGLSANLDDIQFEDNASGVNVTGSSLGGYNSGNPSNSINYISSHDHHTLWDHIVAKNYSDANTSFDMRKRMQWMGISLVAFAQGTPFFQAGTELLRSKSGDGDSSNSGEWFNRLEFNVSDFSNFGTNFGVGLPPVASNSASELNFWSPLLNDVSKQGRSQLTARDATVEHFKTMLAIREDLGALRLEDRSSLINSGFGFLSSDKFTATEFSNGAGVIILRFNDTIFSPDDQAKSEAANPEYSKVVVVFNMQRQDVSFDWGEELSLHPRQVFGSGQNYDAELQDAEWTSGADALTVPGLSTAVFVKARAN